MLQEIVDTVITPIFTELRSLITEIVSSILPEDSTEQEAHRISLSDQVNGPTMVSSACFWSR